MSRILKFIVLFATVATVAHSAEWVQTHEFGTFYPGSYGDPYTDTWSFNQFNDQGGDWELQDIRIEFVLYAWGGFIGQDNDAEVGNSGLVSIDVLGNVDSEDVNMLKDDFSASWDLSITESDTFVLLADDGDGDAYQAGGGDWDSLTAPDESNKTAAIIDANIFSGVFDGYIGADVFEMTFTASQILSFLSGGVASSSEPQQSDGFVRITYDFIPEPMTMSLMGAGGLVALLANRMRRKSE